MDKEQLEKIIATNQAALDQLWLGLEEQFATLNQIIGIATPGLITHFLSLLSIQTQQNINKRRLENMS